MDKKFRIIIVSVLLFFLVGSSFAGNQMIDDGQEIFFSEDIGAKLTQFKDFPVTWWNFLVWDLPESPDAETWAKMGGLCQSLKEQYAPLLNRLECKQELTQYQNTLQNWSRDLPLRRPLKNINEFKQALNRAITKASLPTSPELLSLIRMDPFESYKELNKLISQKVGIDLEREEGFFFDPKFNRVVVPVQFGFPPDQDTLTKKILGTFSDICHKNNLCARWNLLGPHGSTVENKYQVIADVKTVSTVGLIVLGLATLILIKIGRARLLFLFPAVFIAFVATVALTILGYSSIHGLTMAFGIGNIGLSLDYGFHSAFNVGKKKIWLSNFFGLLTTGVVLLVLSFSKIPLLQQLMLFSLCGLTIAFMIFWIMFRIWPNQLRVKPLALRPNPAKYKAIVVSIVFLGGLISILGHSFNLSMSAMDYQSKDQKVFRNWISDKMDSEVPLFEIYSASSNEGGISPSHQRLSWAKENNIRLENAANFIPDQESQQKNLATWRSVLCEGSELKIKLSSVESKFFEPFFENINCENLTHAKRTKPPTYVPGFFSKGRELSLWFPTNDIEAQKITQQFPGASSLKELANVFPNTLLRELQWMMPLALGLILLILFFYYRRLSITLISLLPFLTAVGLVLLVHYLLKIEFSFVGMIALLMVCGISVDYGIFATDACQKEPNHSQDGVWTALLFAALSTITGFLPLVFSKHPVLLQLGQTLTIGILGTILGTFWGIPYFMDRNMSRSQRDQ